MKQDVYYRTELAIGNEPLALSWVALIMLIGRSPVLAGAI